MKINRRNFNGFLFSASLFSLYPNFLNSANIRDKYLVLIELQGANDGLNTVIPYSNPYYYNLRPNIAIKKEEILTIEKNIGLHFIEIIRDLEKAFFLKKYEFSNSEKKYSKITSKHWVAKRDIQKGQKLNLSNLKLRRIDQQKNYNCEFESIVNKKTNKNLPQLPNKNHSHHSRQLS